MRLLSVLGLPALLLIHSCTFSSAGDGGPSSDAGVFDAGGPSDSTSADSGPAVGDSGTTKTGGAIDAGAADAGALIEDSGSLTPDEACDAFLAETHEVVDEVKIGHLACAETTDCVAIEDVVLSCEEQNTEVTFCPIAVSSDSLQEFMAELDESFSDLCGSAPAYCISAATCAELAPECAADGCVMQ